MKSKLLGPFFGLWATPLLVASLAAAGEAAAASREPAVLEVRVTGFDPALTARLLEAAHKELAGAGEEVVPAAPRSASEGRVLETTVAGHRFVLTMRRADTVFVFRVEQLDGSRVVSVAELPWASETLEEVLASLVAAVLHRELPSAPPPPPIERQSWSSGVTGHFVLGAGVGLSGVERAGIAGNPPQVSGGLGYTVGFLVETDQFGIGGDWMGLLGEGHLGLAANVEGYWFFRQGSWSPYLGGGLGGMKVELGDNSGGAGALAEIGVELLRDEHTHLLLGAQAIAPFYLSSSGSFLPSVLANARVAF